MKVKEDMRDRIFTVADALFAEGIEQPTNDQVRERLGGGSLSHISPAMREWRALRAAKNQNIPELPVDLKKTMETALGQVWATASRLAAVTVDAVRQEAAMALSVTQGERDEALTEVGRLEHSLEELRVALADRNNQMAKLEDTLRDEVALNAQLTRDCAVLNTQVQEKAERLQALMLELEAARAAQLTLQGELVDIARRAHAVNAPTMQ